MQKKDGDIKNVYRQIVQMAVNYDVKKVVLFGSRARKTNVEKSDIDLAVYGCQLFDEFCDDLNENLWTLLELDIINMEQNVSIELMEEIQKDGVVLYEKI